MISKDCSLRGSGYSGIWAEFKRLACPLRVFESHGLKGWREYLSRRNWDVGTRKLNSCWAQKEEIEYYIARPRVLYSQVYISPHNSPILQKRKPKH